VTVLTVITASTFIKEYRGHEFSGRVLSRPREVCRMLQSFGARLRQRREEQQIALSTIAEQTKIKLSLLEALERDDVSHWPSGIFRRAFVRTYAHAIGLQPDVVVREFLERYPDPLEDPAAPSIEALAEAASSSAGPPTRFRYLVGAAVDSLSRMRQGNGQRRIAHADDSGPVGSVPIDIPDTRDVPVIPDTPQTPTDAPMTIEAVAAQPAAVEPGIAEGESVPYEPEIAVGTPPFEPDLSAAALLCTELSRVDDTRDVAPLLGELARVVDAVGLIVWVWDAQAAELTPALPHGYSAEVLAQLPNVPRDARNATAAAFRSAQTCIVSGGDVASDALVVPMMTRAGCAGVLAIELQSGAARRESTRALATIFAAQMARLVAAVRPAAAANRRLA
jgi:transcriptional regulator with XRE-family HTH domain